MNTQTKIRPPAVAGSFYPASAAALQKEVRRLLDATTLPSLPGPVVAVMAPHAGYVFSAAVAAPAYKALATTDAETVVIIGHDFGRQAPNITAVLADYDAYDTPLGKVQVDTEMNRRLQAVLPSAYVHNGVHSREHSIEIHLPFLKTLLPNAKILPILFGEVNVNACRSLANALREASGGRRIAILASTDLSHYPAYENAQKIDRDTVAIIADLDLQRLCARKDGKGVPANQADTAICSAGGVGTALAWLENYQQTKVVILETANSGDVQGSDRKRVVGYASAAICGQKNDAKSDSKPTKEENMQSKEEFKLSEDACVELLTSARRCLSAKLQKQTWAYQPPSALPELAAPAAVFVTLTIDGRLRGCIGHTAPRMPLWQAVHEMAVAAALEDPRFPALTVAELKQSSIEISVLSPMTPVASASEIIPGTHGVVVRRGGRSGLFLPQVWEQLPRLERFMQILCQEKAGLAANAWQDPGTTILVFTVFAMTD